MTETQAIKINPQEQRAAARARRTSYSLFFLLAAAAFLILPSIARAQTSTISATITDADGTPWASLNNFNAPYTIQLLSSAGVPVSQGQAFVSSTGQAVTVTLTGNTSNSGAFSANLPNNSAITPSGTRWQFSVCPAVSSGTCASYTTVVSASASISAQLSAQTIAPRISGGPGAFAYADVEVAAIPNNSYLNITATPTLRCFSVSWGNCGTATGTGTVTTVSVTTANGVSGTVATPTTTPAITLTLGAITPVSVNALAVGTGSSTSTGVALGTNALGGSGGVSGADNAAVGYDALDTSSGTLTNSTAVGAFAGLGATGTANTILGYSAGLTSASGAMTGSNNTVLGANATISAAADTNETVVGEAAAGSGPNTMTFGNSSVTGNFFFGTLTTPSLKISGITGSTQCAQISATGVVSGTGSACGSGGSPAFSALISGTNTVAAMLVGSGASLAAAGTGTITATSIPFSGVTGTPSTTQVPFQSLTTTGSSGAATLSAGVLNIPQYSGGGGTINAAGQYSSPYYSASGSATTLSGLAAPTTAGTYVFAWQPSGSAVAPTALNLATYLASPPAVGGTTPAAGTFTTVTTSGGPSSIVQSGSTSGSVTLVPQAVAGTPTITWPTTTGTVADAATSPLAINTTTGNLTCSTCATTTNGGALTGTSPVAVSAAGAISLSGATGQIPNGATGAFTATPTLGASGTLGSLTLGNATSGTVTVQPVTGALGTVTASIPANTGTVAETNLAQTFSAVQTISATNGLVLSAMTGTNCLEEVSGVVTATGSACGSGGSGLSANAPLWLQFIGTGGDGAGNCSGNLTGDYHYTTFTVAYGNTCTVNTNQGLVIHATGACTIAGTLTGSGSSNSPYFGGSGGGGGGGSTAGASGTNAYAAYNNQGPTIANGGSAGAASGGTGGAGATPGTSLTRIGVAGAATFDGTQLGGGPGGGGGNGGGAGGNSGAGITLICASFTGTDGTHTGSIITTGANGSASPGNNQGSGGGGGGGGVIISSQAAVTTYPTITTTGGTGGSCGAFTGCGVGGTGGSGPIVEYSGW